MQMSACAAFASEPLVPEAFFGDTIARDASSSSLPVKVKLSCCTRTNSISG